MNSGSKQVGMPPNAITQPITGIRPGHTKNVLSSEIYGAGTTLDGTPRRMHNFSNRTNNHLTQKPSLTKINKPSLNSFRSPTTNNTKNLVTSSQQLQNGSLATHENPYLHSQALPEGTIQSSSSRRLPTNMTSKTNNKQMDIDKSQKMQKQFVAN